MMETYWARIVKVKVESHEVFWKAFCILFGNNGEAFINGSFHL